MKLPHWLRKLSVRRVALVDRPANPDAEVVLYKAASGLPPRDADGDWDNDKMLPASDDGTCPSCKVPLGDDGKCPECGYTAKAPEGGQGPPSKLPKSPPGSDEHDAYKGMNMADDTKAVIERVEQSALVAELEKERAEKRELVEKLKNGDLVEKATVQTLKAEIDREKAEKRLLAERVEKIELARRNEVYVAKAREFDYLPGAKADDWGPILSKIDAALSDSERQYFWSIQRGANEAIKHSALFGEVGREGFGGLGTSDAENALDKIAKSYMEAEPKLTYADAYTKAAKDNPKLYEKYEADRRSARR